MYVIVWSPSVTCPAGFYYIYDGCYQRTSTNQAMPWIGAGITAAEQNATLASVHSMAHYRWLRELMSCRGWSIGEVWLGGNDISTEGSFMNLDGSVFDFVDWARENPDNGDGWRNCVYFYLYDSEWKWRDAPCSNFRMSLLKWQGDNAHAQDGEYLQLLCFSISA